MVITREEEIKKKFEDNLLCEQELNVVDDLIILLKPFQEMTILVSASEYVTSSIVLPAVTRLSEVLQLYESKYGFGHINELALKMKDNLDERTKTYFENKLLLSASLLDPRYRSLKFIKDETERDKSFFEATSYVRNIYNNKL